MDKDQKRQGDVVIEITPEMVARGTKVLSAFFCAEESFLPLEDILSMVLLASLGRAIPNQSNMNRGGKPQFQPQERLKKIG